MTSTGPVAALLLLSLLPAPIPLSDPAGVYAVIDRVVYEPDRERPTRIELHGAFAIAAHGRGNFYLSPRHGVLRFALGDEAEQTLRQWRDLERHAGKGTILAFSSRFAQGGPGAVPLRVLEPGADGPAVPFEPGLGLHVVENVDYGPARALRLLPRCEQAAVGGDEQKAPWLGREITLTCRNCAAADEDLAYVFEVETSAGDRVASGVVPAGEGHTTWTARLFVTPGTTVTWSVRAFGEGITEAPVERASFVVGAASESR